MKSYKIGFADIKTTGLSKTKHIKLMMDSIKRNAKKAIDDGYIYITIEFNTKDTK